MFTSDLHDLSTVIKVAMKNNNSSQLSNSLIPQDHKSGSGRKKIPNLFEEKVPTAPWRNFIYFGLILTTLQDSFIWLSEDCVVAPFI